MTEKQVNLHLSHIEDIMFESGINATRDAILFLTSLRDMLSSKSTNRPVSLTSKWDGAPAIIAGINPENGKFFVGTKGVFGAVPKLNYTTSDIERNHPNPGLQSKLEVALRYLPELGFAPNRILQGDLMYTAQDLKGETIDGVKYVTFRPNTILYAVPEESKLAETIRRSKMGIVFHTEYTGKTIETLKARFNPNIAGLSLSKNVWFRDASFTDATGSSMLSYSESEELQSILSDAGGLFRKLSAPFLNKLATTETFRIDLLTFNNSKVRIGEAISDTTKHVVEFLKWLESKYNEKILDAKKPDTRRNRELVKKEIMAFFRNNKDQLKLALDLHNLLVSAKALVVRKLNKVRDIGTFLPTDDGLKVTNPEGFVAINGDGRAVKLVDRLTFSHANFNVAKNWSK